MRLEDLRASNPYSRTLIIGFILGLMGLVFITVHLVQLPKAGTVELMVYMVLFAFLTVRVLLQWRMSTFVPVEDVRPGEWAFLRSLGHFWKTVMVTGGFFALRWLFIPELEEHPGGAKWLGKLTKPLRDLFRNFSEGEVSWVSEPEQLVAERV